jgi:hypothetical protein
MFEPLYIILCYNNLTASHIMVNFKKITNVWKKFRLNTVPPESHKNAIGSKIMYV